jgi:hypothetical protein
VKNINRRATKNPAILLALHKEGFLAPTRGVGTRADGGERKEGFLDPMKPIGTRNDGRERKEGFLAGLKMTTGAFFAARGDEATDRSCCALKVLHHGGRDLKNEVGIHETLIATGLRLMFAKNPTKRPKTRVLIATKLAPSRPRKSRSLTPVRPDEKHRGAEVAQATRLRWFVPIESIGTQKG